MIFWPLLICLVATWYFVGLIWVIQLVHYPLFAYIDQASFSLYHAAHSQRIYLALGVPVLLVFGSSILLFWLHPSAVPLWAIQLNLLLGFGVWVLTALIHVPLHSRLAEQYSLKLIISLVQMNWLRTITWTLQGLFLLWMLAIALPPSL